MTNLIAYFTITLSLIGYDKVSELMESLGYNNSPTPNVLMQVMEEESEAFYRPYGKLAKDALAQPEAHSMVANIVEKTNINKATDPDKVDTAMNILGGITDIFCKSSDSVKDIINATNGTDKAIAQYGIERTLAQQEDEKNKRTIYWILGGIGVILIIAIILAIVMKRN